MAQNDVFVLYGSEDSEWVEHYLLDELTRAGLNVRARASFDPRRLILDQFSDALRSSASILIVLSPAYFAEQWNEFGGKAAVTQAILTGRWQVIPLLHAPVALPIEFSSFPVIDFTKPALIRTERARLFRALGSAPPEPRDSVKCPYPGMRAFTINDGMFFFGRDEEIKTVVTTLASQSFIVVIGSSGSGKSSLVRAGVVPKLKSISQFGPVEWVIPEPFSPGPRPLDALRLVFGADLGNVPRALAALIGENNTPGRVPRRLLLVIDQFEELFTQGAAEQLEFQNFIFRLAQQPNVTLITTLRYDFLEPAMAGPLAPRIKQNPLMLQPLTEDGLRDAIRLPAQAVGVIISSALVERLVADADIGQEKGVLPLVQEALRALWSKLEGLYLSLDAYLQMGENGKSGLQVAMARHADEVFALLPDDKHRLMAQRIFLNLVHPLPDHPTVLRSQRLQELRDAAADVGVFNDTAATLEAGRLILVGNARRPDEARIDLAHERLITGWARLAEWVEQFRDALDIQSRLQEKSAEWQRRPKQDSGFLDAIELQEAKVWRSSANAQLLVITPGIDEFIRASERNLEVQSAAQAAQRTRRTYLGALAALAITLLVVGIVLGALLATEQGPFRARAVWKPVPFFGTSPITVIRRAADGTLYAGLGRAGLPYALAVSHTRGSNWDPLPLQAPTLNDLLLDTTTPGLVFAASGGKGLVRSWNSGANWEPIQAKSPTGEPIPFDNVIALAQSPGGTLYAGEATHGVFTSQNQGNDRGDVWTPLSGGPTARLVYLAWIDNQLLVSDLNYRVWQWTPDGGWRVKFDSIPVTRVVGRNGKLWLGGDGLFQLQQGSPYRTLDSSHHLTALALTAPPPDLIVAGILSSGQVLMFDAETGEVLFENNNQDFGGSTYTSAILVDSSPTQTFWVATNRGLYRGEIRRQLGLLFP